MKTAYSYRLELCIPLLQPEENGPEAETPYVKVQLISPDDQMLAQLLLGSPADILEFMSVLGTACEGLRDAIERSQKEAKNP